MDGKILTAIIGLIGSILIAIIGFYVGKEKTYLEHNKSISIEAWKERNNQYKRLMKIMKVLPKYPHQIGSVEYKDLLNCSNKLKDWYFEGGGLFLTNKSREKYFNVQKDITKRIFNDNFSDTIPLLSTKVSKEDYNSVRGLMSELRTELTNDLLSRERDILMNKNELINKKEENKDYSQQTKTHN